MVALPDPLPPNVPPVENPPGYARRTCTCGRTTVLEPIDLPEAERVRCPFCEAIEQQTVIRGHLIDVEQLGSDQGLADGLRNGRVVLVVDE